MPREFYPDTVKDENITDDSVLCNNETQMFDGPGICTRAKGHKLEKMTNDNWGTGEFHQESFEGWVWDGEGSIA